MRIRQVLAGAAGMILWMVLGRYLPMLGQMPGMLVLIGFSIAALLLDHWAALVVVGIGVFWLEAIRPAAMSVHVARALVDSVIGGAIVALAYARSQQSRSLRQYAVLFEQHPVPMLVIEARGRGILRANAAAATLYGFSPAEFATLTLDRLRAPQADGHDLTWDVDKPSGEDTHVRKDGQRMDVFIRAQEVVTDGRPARLLVIEDTGDRRRLEEQLRHAQKMEAIGLLAGGIAHDFNNLLTAVRGYAGLIIDALPESHPQREDAIEIDRAGARAASLTTQLLAFSRKQFLQVRVVAPNDVVQDLTPMLQRLVGEQVQLHAVCRSTRNVRVDPTQLQQVIVNLVVNARDAVQQPGGVVTLETGDVVFDQEYVRRHPAARVGPHVVLSVTDNGHGMSPETQARIFEPFFTTKRAEQGTGLGLSTVYGIVQQSGGHIWVYSEPDRGTTFKLYFPATTEPAETVNVARANFPATPSGRTILVVEDEPAVQNLVTRVLERGGYRFETVRSIGELRTLLDSDAGPVDLLLTDLVLPDGDGPTAAALVAARHPAAPVLFMSGYTDDAVVRHGILNAEAEFIQKPFSAAALLDRVKAMLG
jgi:PAS domain S-box-containing protein